MAAEIAQLESILPVHQSSGQLAMERFLNRPSVRTLVADESIYTDRRLNVDSAVLNEVDQLRGEGYDIEIVDTPPRHNLPHNVQNAVDEEVAWLSNQPDCAEILFDANVHPVGHVWHKLAKHPISLHTLYGSGVAHTLADGVNPEVYDELLFNGKSAADLLREINNNGEEAEIILRNHIAYASTAMDEQTGAFPSSRDFLVGVIDSRAVQTRADTAVNMAKERIVSRPEQFNGREIVCASLACGSAGPIYELAKSLSENGAQIGKLILVDNSPMALASAISLARSQGVDDRIEYHRRNLFRNNLTTYLGHKSIDFVDLLGLIDYFPVELTGNNGKVHYPLKALLEDVRNVMRPGGMVLVGNMLNIRPQQSFFKKVWPDLHQRGIGEMLSIIANAGYDPSKVQVRIPGREGVYAIYGIPIPEANTDQVDSTQHRLGKWAVNQLQY